MKPFDQTTYLKEVLAPFVDASEPPDVFHRYLLDYSDNDETAIEQRMAAVKSVWDKKANHPKHGGLINLLRGSYAQDALTLLDGSERGRAAAALGERGRARAEEREKNIARWEASVEEYVQQEGGLTPHSRDQLQRAAEAEGIPTATVERRLNNAPEKAVPEMLDGGRRKQIRQALTSLAKTEEKAHLGLSLFHAFDLQVTQDTALVETRVREQAQSVAEMGQTGKPGLVRKAWDGVLSQARTVLIQSDPRAYIEAMVHDVVQELHPLAVRLNSDGVIDELEARQLKEAGIELGLTPELADRALADVASEVRARLRTGVEVDYIACPRCNRPHDRSRGEQRCAGCGDELYVTCPTAACTQVSDATSNRCSACGADLHGYLKAKRSLLEVKQDLDVGRLGAARRRLTEAREVVGPDDPAVLSMGELVASTERQALELWEEASTALGGGRIYGAGRALSRLKTLAVDVEGPDGRPPDEAFARNSAQLAKAESELTVARSLTGAAREARLAGVLDIAADSTEAASELDRISPATPTDLRVETEAGVHRLSWSPSPSPGVRYEVSRATVGATSKLLARVREPSHQDDTGEAGDSVVYEVAAVRGRARSEVVRSDPALVAREIGDVEISSGDGEVRLAWAPPDAGRVVVARREAGGHAETEIRTDSTGAVDRSVSNGTSYAYRIHIEYATTSGPVRTPGVERFAQPAERPKPLRGLTTRTEGGMVKVFYSPPEQGTITVVACSAEPAVEPGQEVNPAGVSELGRALAPGATGALDDRPGRVSWYLPVTIAGGVAIAGHAVRHVELAAIENVQAVESSGKIRVTWSWPEQAKLARVVWRGDRQPTGPDDPDAESAPIRMGEYRDNGGFTLDPGSPGPLFVAVYPGARVDGETVIGSLATKGSRAAVRAERKLSVSYEVRQTGVLKKHLNLRVCEPSGEQGLPTMVLVGRSGDILPNGPGDGKVLATIGGGEPLTANVDLKGQPRPLAVRLFVETSASAASYTIRDPAASSLVIGG